MDDIPLPPGHIAHLPNHLLPSFKPRLFHTSNAWHTMLTSDFAWILFMIRLSHLTTHALENKSFVSAAASSSRHLLEQSHHKRRLFIDLLRCLLQTKLYPIEQAGATSRQAESQNRIRARVKSFCSLESDADRCSDESSRYCVAQRSVAAPQDHI